MKKPWILQHQHVRQVKIYFFGTVRDKMLNRGYLELLKRRSKVHQKNISHERALDLDQ